MKKEISLVLAILTTGYVLLSSYFSINEIIITINGQPQEQKQAQLQLMGVKITSVKEDQQVPIGNLTISGTSTDNSATNCQVYADINDVKPLQNTTATGPGGPTDYSNWTFTYTKSYHLISEGVNELTAKLSCIGNPVNGSKWYTVNVTGTGLTTTKTTPTETANNNTAASLQGNGRFSKIVNQTQHNQQQLQDQLPVTASHLSKSNNSNYEYINNGTTTTDATTNAIDLINRQIPLSKVYENIEDKTSSKTETDMKSDSEEQKDAGRKDKQQNNKKDSMPLPLPF
jgi:hypothetical protein